MARRARIRAVDARKVVEELVTGRGRMLDIAEEYPWLIEESQQVLEEKCRNPVPCFRSLTIPKGENVRREQVVSTTLRPAYALRLATDAPGLVFARDKTIELQNVTLRYDVPVDDTLLYVPLLLDWVLSEQPNVVRRMNVEMRGGEVWKGIDVIREIEERQEEELLADVSGVEPEALVWPAHVSGRRDLHVALSVAQGRYRGPEAEMHGHGYMDPDAVARHIEQVAEMAADWVEGACVR